MVRRSVRGPQDAATAARPFRNILLLFADQHRQDAIGCYGNPVVRTPHIDRLAAGGVRFTHAFTPTATCTPARASLQSGLIARRHGLLFPWEFHRHRGGELNLLPGTRFFSQDLAAAGCQLAHVGKWHIGDVNYPADFGYEGVYHHGYGFPAEHPHYLAYLKSLGLTGFNLSEHRYAHSGQYLYSALQEGPPEASVPGYLAHQTIDYINRFSAKDRPFFISCNFWGPHGPVRIPRPYHNMYPAGDIELPPNFDTDLSDRPYMIQRQLRMHETTWLDRQTFPDLIARYYGYTTLIDDQIGRILAALEAAGHLDDTLIVYSADHGEGLGSYRMWDKGFGMYEFLYRIPLIFSHPSLTPGVNESFASLLDFAPTFLEAAGLPVPDGLDGRSLLPILAGQSAAVHDDWFIAEGYGQLIPFWQRMVRSRDAKYVYNPSDRDEFYDLADDPHETRNIIDSVGAERLKPYKDRLLQWLADTKDPLVGFARKTI